LRGSLTDTKIGGVGFAAIRRSLTDTKIGGVGFAAIWIFLLQMFQFKTTVMMVDVAIWKATQCSHQQDPPPSLI